MRPPTTLRSSTALREAVPPSRARPHGGRACRANAPAEPGFDCLPVDEGWVKMLGADKLGGGPPASPTSFLTDAAERIPGLPGAVPFAFASTRPVPWRS
jgi:hypothetical protein